MSSPSIYNIKGAVAVWDFRSGSDWGDRDEIFDVLRQIAKKWTLQYEKGDLGYYHWQGRLSLWKKREGAALAALWQKIGIEIPNYCQPSAAENCKGEMFYAMKADTRVDGPWDHRETIRYVQKNKRNVVLKPWQTFVMTDAERFDERVVDVVWDPPGNHGKSFLMEWANQHKKGIMIPTSNDAKELVAAVMNILVGQQLREPKLMFIDLPRAMEKKHLRGMYTAIETIKNGHVWDFRYQFKEWIFEQPRVWVFSNVLPDKEWLTADRWRIWTFDSQDNLQRAGPECWESSNAVLPVPI